MRETWQVVLAGEGGQGLVVAGLLLAEAAVCEGRNAAQTQSYGIASRGGFSQSEVVISAGEIVYPGVEVPDLVLALTPRAYDLYVPLLPAGAFLFYDRDLVSPRHLPEGVHSYGLPFYRRAREMGRPEVLNMVALGAMAAHTGIVKLDSLEKAIEKRFPTEVAAFNIRALRAGARL
ncbi:2-oxoacid:acceptor oxidoreductase family protein [Desulfovirgula thermocuniculi]|uniref:2-oxoacid:acceptor oxidoreductase family protein n=1 Tax=Desulfovirgula thermocuniculi TaxID=348842 RepID=UPI0003F7DC04|nr:2-oxoacid:acceptor oxidoreductase family protein [Desulfovirgula thermocuniculi]